MKLREKILISSFKANACHLGSALSCVEVVESIYETKSKSDIFLFAKATGVVTLYCLLHPISKAWKYLKKYPLPSSKVPGVLWTGGSCGTGLSVAVGIALAKKMEGKKGKVYCLISDGELNEGQTWEAVMFSAQHKLYNLVVVIDNNGFQSLGATKDIIDLKYIHNKFYEFKWQFVTVNGHSKDELKFALSYNSKKRNQMPKVIVANTVKGKGVKRFEGDNNWHYRNLTKELLDKSLEEVK